MEAKDPILLSLHESQRPRFKSSYLEYLTEEEADQIRNQFRNQPLQPGCQVMWTGVPRAWAQLWADKNHMQTLTTAMGPLMDAKDPSCVKSSKSKKQWQRYVKGASALFAEYLPKAHVVTVLSRPPPQRFQPEGISTYQIIEEPLLRGIHGGTPVSRIDMVHVGVQGAENYRYQVWPRDETHTWVEKYHHSPLRKHFRKVDVNSKEVESEVSPNPNLPCLQKKASQTARYEEVAGTSRIVLQPSNKSYPELEKNSAINRESNLKLDRSGMQILSSGGKPATITKKDEAGTFTKGKRQVAKKKVIPNKTDKIEKVKKQRKKKKKKKTKQG